MTTEEIRRTTIKERTRVKYLFKQILRRLYCKIFQKGKELKNNFNVNEMKINFSLTTLKHEPNSKYPSSSAYCRENLKQIKCRCAYVKHRNK